MVDRGAGRGWDNVAEREEAVGDSLIERWGEVFVVGGDLGVW